MWLQEDVGTWMNMYVAYCPMLIIPIQPSFLLKAHCGSKFFFFVKVRHGSNISFKSTPSPALVLPMIGKTSHFSWAPILTHTLGLINKTHHCGSGWSANCLSRLQTRCCRVWLWGVVASSHSLLCLDDKDEVTWLAIHVWFTWGKSRVRVVRGQRSRAALYLLTQRDIGSHPSCLVLFLSARPSLR